MPQCRAKGCISYALNDDRESGYCDVCLYKIPLLDLLARVHRDGGEYTHKHGLKKSVDKAHKTIAKAVVK